MKKTLHIFALIMMCLFVTNQTLAQCTPNASNLTLITPDTVTNFVSGTVGQPYSQIVYVHVPDDTVVTFQGNTVTVTMVNITLNSISNLPPGLTNACNPANCIFPGNASGCLLISGTPTTAGLYELSVIITSNVTLIGFPVSQQDTIESYRILVNPDPSGINANYNPAAFEILNINTASFTDVSVKINAPSKMNSKFQVIDMIGKVVSESSFELSQGINNINIPAGSLKNGMYLLKVTGNSKAITGRFVVAKNK